MTRTLTDLSHPLHDRLFTAATPTALTCCSPAGTKAGALPVRGGRPYLSEDAARSIADRRAALVGIDAVDTDDLADQARPAHSILLAAGC